MGINALVDYVAVPVDVRKLRISSIAKIVNFTDVISISVDVPFSSIFSPAQIL